MNYDGLSKVWEIKFSNKLKSLRFLINFLFVQIIKKNSFFFSNAANLFIEQSELGSSNGDSARVASRARASRELPRGWHEPSANLLPYG